RGRDPGFRARREDRRADHVLLRERQLLPGARDDPWTACRAIDEAAGRRRDSGRLREHPDDPLLAQGDLLRGAVQAEDLVARSHAGRLGPPRLDGQTDLLRRLRRRVDGRDDARFGGDHGCGEGATGDPREDLVAQVRVRDRHAATLISAGESAAKVLRWSSGSSDRQNSIGVWMPASASTRRRSWQCSRLPTTAMSSTTSSVSAARTRRQSPAAPASRISAASSSYPAQARNELKTGLVKYGPKSRRKRLRPTSASSVTSAWMRVATSNAPASRPSRSSAARIVSMMRGSAPSGKRLRTMPSAAEAASSIMRGRSAARKIGTSTSSGGWR